MVVDSEEEVVRSKGGTGRAGGGQMARAVQGMRSFAKEADDRASLAAWHTRGC